MQATANCLMCDLECTNECVPCNEVGFTEFQRACGIIVAASLLPLLYYVWYVLGGLEWLMKI